MAGSGLIGMDPHAAKQLAKRIATAAEALQQQAAGMTAAVSQVPWRGPVAERFRSDWHNAALPNLTRVITELRESGSRLTAEAAEQEGASSAGRSQGVSQGVPMSSTPSQVQAWWSGLDKSQQDFLIQSQPDKIGSLDGIPADARHRANMIRLAALHELLSKKSDKITADLMAGFPVWGFDFDKLRSGVDALGALQKRIESLELLKGMIDKSRSGDQPPLYLLDIGASGDGKAIVAVGNPDTASHLSVYIPGTGAKLDEFQEEVETAQANYRAATTHTKDSVSSIVWLGYDAPEWKWGDGPTNDFHAKRAAPELRSFLNGMAVTHEVDRQHVTLLGYSYGSRVVGETILITPGLKADVISIGGPGVGVDYVKGNDMPHPSELKIQGKIYSIAGEYDPVANWSDDHGLSAAELPGAKVIDIGSDGSGHKKTSYWGSEKFLDHLGRLIVGKEAK
ncbi:hypothetical protein GCM10027290_13640 [Micromonospora sonneratiae]|uniref:Alpha/beta hydrolase n=1 Tax=Micromonospora sonneratiae TaxID=1184706 RepID=A0ABW3YMG2_9ACTN